MQPDGATGFLKSVDGAKFVTPCLGICAAHPDCSVVMLCFLGGNVAYMEEK